MDKVKWGILSTAKIAREKVIPAMQRGKFCEITAIASRNAQQAQEVASRLDIPKAYDSYEALLNDADIDAVYIPLPNQMHVPWSIKAIEAGKHVLVEKPIGLSSNEAWQLLQIAQQKPQLKVMEAFMYRFHPQWQYAKKMVGEGNLGQLKTIQSLFSYFNADPKNIRNQEGFGGGGLMDIGCYCISLSRFLFGKEPERVFGKVEFDRNFNVDQLATAILDFTTGTSSFTCSTQLTPYQRVNILGTDAGIEIEIPFNAPPDAPTRAWLHAKSGREEIVFETADQYTIQGDLMSQAILYNTEVPTPLEDAINNMKVIEAISASSEEEQWRSLQ